MSRFSSASHSAQVRLDQLGERQAARDPPLPTDTIELTLERGCRILLRGKPASLHTTGATRDPVAIRAEALDYDAQPGLDRH
jgi:hypothetical protein